MARKLDLPADLPASVGEYMNCLSSILLLIMTEALCIALSACAGNTKQVQQSNVSPPVIGQGSSSRSIGKLEYEGTAHTTITYLDASGNVVSKATYQDNVTVGIGDPQRSGSIAESNPVNLFLGSVSKPTAEGQLSIFSAIPFKDPRDGVEYLLQYWDLRLEGDTISGRLINTHMAEASVMNFLNANKEIVPGRPEMGVIMWPYPIGENSKLEGTFNKQGIRLRIQGNVSDESRPFTSEIVATRKE